GEFLPLGPLRGAGHRPLSVLRARRRPGRGERVALHVPVALLSMRAIMAIPHLHRLIRVFIPVLGWAVAATWVGAGCTSYPSAPSDPALDTEVGNHKLDAYVHGRTAGEQMPPPPAAPLNSYELGVIDAWVAENPLKCSDSPNPDPALHCVAGSYP